MLRVAFSCAYLSVKKCIKMDISPCSNMQILILKSAYETFVGNMEVILEGLQNTTTS